MRGTDMLATWSQPWLIVLLLALAVGMLEAERWWARWLRRRGQRLRHLDGGRLLNA